MQNYEIITSYTYNILTKFEYAGKLYEKKHQSILFQLLIGKIANFVIGRLKVPFAVFTRQTRTILSLP